MAMLPPGRETRFSEAPLHDIAQVISRSTAAIAPWIDGPFTLFGHSLGALVAYEVARRLSAMGKAPESLIVSGHLAPSAGLRRLPIAHLPDAAFLRSLRDLGGTPAEVFEAPELLALLLPMLRADFTLAEQYHEQPGPRLTCAVTALGGIDDPWVDCNGLAAWGDVTTGPFDHAMLPGDHFYLASARAELVARINNNLASLRAAA
jgi:medium-chain acyl-[acyl-carrier-protein] hydrolase